MRLRVCLLGGFLIGSASSAVALPITGSIVFSGTSGQLALEGEDFLFIGSVSSGIFDPRRDCIPCDPGETVSLGGAWGGSSVGASTLIINEFSHTLSMGSPRAANVQLFLAGSILAPELIGTTATASAPFQLSGSIRYHPDPTVPLSELGIPASLGLSGVGTATLTFGRNEDSPYWTYLSAFYVIDEPPALVPEPSTLALLGAGLAGGATRLVRRRGKRLRALSS